MLKIAFSLLLLLYLFTPSRELLAQEDTGDAAVEAPSDNIITDEPEEETESGDTSALDQDETKTESTSEVETAETEPKKEEVAPEPAPVVAPAPKPKREQDFTPKDNAKTLNLKTVIEQGLRLNSDQKVRNYTKELLKIDWEDKHEAFWLPKVNLVMDTSDERLWRFRGGSRPNGTSPSLNGSFGIEMGDYTVFNWGKDYLDYQNNKSTFEKDTRNLAEEKIRLKHSLINEYFKLNLLKNAQKIYMEQMRHATFVYRLAREKIALGRMNKQEYYESRSYYLQSQLDYQQARLTAISEDQVMANYIGDELENGTYKTLEGLKYAKLKISIEESLNLTAENSDEIKNAKVNLENAQRSYEKGLKDNLPLPKFSVKLGAYKQYFGQDANSALYETYPKSSALDLAASFHLTWNLVGEGGLFNSRNTESTFIKSEISKHQFNDKKRSVDLNVRTLYKQLMFMESQIEILDVQMDAAKKSFDATIENYNKDKARFIDVKNSIANLKNTELQYDFAIFQHLSLKIQLANAINIEDFPGENFETLVEKAQ